MCLFYDSRFVHYDDAVVLYVFDDDAVGADSYVVSDTNIADDFRSAADIETLSPITGLPCLRLSAKVLDPMVTCWNMTAFFPISAPSETKIPYMPCGNTGTSSILLSIPIQLP